MPPEHQEAPTFQFESFAFERIFMETHPRVPPSEGETLEPGIAIDFRPRAEIEIDHDNKRARVLLGFKVEPDPKKQPYVLIVEIVGIFSLQTGTIDHLIQFARAGAASVLFPYVRQMISTVTRDGKWGPLLINPINVQTMLQWQETPPDGTSGSNEPPRLPSQSPSDERDSKS